MGQSPAGLYGYSHLTGGYAGGQAEYLRVVRADANAIKIPYRANRAVVFNSDLFHETDEIAFKDDYLSRRINITLLYGYR